MVALRIGRDNTGLAAFSYKAQVSIFIMSPDPTFDIISLVCIVKKCKLEDQFLIYSRKSVFKILLLLLLLLTY